MPVLRSKPTLNVTTSSRLKFHTYTHMLWSNDNKIVEQKVTSWYR